MSYLLLGIILNAYLLLAMEDVAPEMSPEESASFGASGGTDTGVADARGTWTGVTCGQAPTVLLSTRNLATRSRNISFNTNN